MAILNTSGAAGGGTVSGELKVAYKNVGFGATSMTFTGLSVTKTPSFYLIALIDAGSSPNHTTAYYIYDNGNVTQAIYETSSTLAVIKDGTIGPYAWTVAFNSAGECTVTAPTTLATLGKYCLYYKAD